MTRREWNDLAVQLAKVHVRLAAKRRLERAAGIEIATRVLCRFIRQRTSRFDSRVFMRAFTAAK